MTDSPEKPGGAEKKEKKVSLKNGLDAYGLPDNLPEMRLDMQRVMHKLKVHQLELEMQQEELNRANIKLEQSTTHYNELYDFSPIGAMTLSENGTIVEINLTCTTLFGITRSNLVGARFMQFVALHDRLLFKNFLNSIFASNSSDSVEVEFINQQPMQLCRFFRIDAVAHRSKDVCHATVIDITAQKKSVVEIKKLETKLAVFQKVELMKRFSRGIGQDFQSTMTEMDKKMDLVLQSTSLDSASREQLLAIKQGLHRSLEMSGLLSALGSSTPIKSEKMDINAVLSDQLDSLKLLVDEKINMTVQKSINPAFVSIDRNQLCQILGNLVDNAQEAMPNGGMLKLKIYHHHLHEDEIYPDTNAIPGEYVCIEISDTGMGMTKESADHLFDPFFTTKSNGTGLGLPIVQGITKQNMGLVTVETQFGTGTTVRVYLPCYA